MAADGMSIDLDELFESLPNRWKVRIKFSAHLFEGFPCWEWHGWNDGKDNGRGHAKTKIQGKAVYVHRAIYEMVAGDVPAEYVMDHRCENMPCCNPKHLEVVTVRENTYRGGARLFGPNGAYGESEEVPF